MNIYCSSSQDDEFLEAMNTLENGKSKQNEKYNYYSQLNFVDNNNNNSPKKINFLTTRDPTLTGINTKKHKNSSFLEIIDYPFSQNKRRISEIHLQTDSNITDKNGETELMIEYINKYMKDSKNSIKNYQNKINDNITFRNNLIDNQKNDNFNICNILNNNNDNSLNSYSNNSIIINNDYNTSIITEMKFNRNIWINSDKITALNKKKYEKILSINNKKCINGKAFKSSYYLSNKYKKTKIHTYGELSKNDFTNNSNLYCYGSKNSILYNRNSYSNDTEITKDNIKAKNDSINIIKINKQNKLFKESNYKIKEKIKDIPIGKNNNIRKNPLDIKNKEKYFNSNYNIINNINIHNFEVKIKSINSTKNINSKISDKHFNNSNIRIKTSNQNKKHLCLSSIEKNINSKKNKTIRVDKSMLNINYLNRNIENKLLHKNFSYSKNDSMNKNKRYLLTDTRKLFNGVKKIKQKKSNSEKTKNLKPEKNKDICIYRTSNIQNKNLFHIFSNNQLNDYKQLIKYYYRNKNHNNINNRINNNIYIQRYSGNNLYKKNNCNLDKKKLNISYRNQNDQNFYSNNNSNKSFINNSKSQQNNKVNKIINYNKIIKTIIPNNKIKLDKTSAKCKSFESTRNNPFYINAKTLKNQDKYLQINKTFNNLFFYTDKIQIYKKKSKSKNKNSKIPNNKAF